MTWSPLAGLVKATPFQPFTVTTSSGQQVLISTPKMIILGRRRDTVAYVDQHGQDRWVLIRHDLIASIDAHPQSPPA